jgi:hypothetical protein
MAMVLRPVFRNSNECGNKEGVKRNFAILTPLHFQLQGNICRIQMAAILITLVIQKIIALI